MLTPSDDVNMVEIQGSSERHIRETITVPPNNDEDGYSMRSGSATSLPRTISRSSALEDDSDDMDHSNAGSVNQQLTVDNYGFLCDASDSESFVTLQDTGPPHSRLGRVLGLHKDREAKWIEILSGYNVDYVKHSTRIKRLVGYGIPDSLRGQVWQYLADSHAYRQPGLYRELLSKERLEIYDVIEKDIQRCYPDHIMFYEANGNGQTNLYEVLKAYAHYNPEVGYCQGMGRLVGMMLMQNISPEDTFWLLVATIDKYLSGYYTPTLSKLRIHAAVFDRLLLIHNPKLHRKLVSNDVVPLMYMTQWFLTVYTMTLPWSTVLHVWDLLFLRGVKVLFRTGLAILDCCKDHLLNHCPSNTEILSFLLHIPHEILQPSAILEASKKINLKSSEVEKLSKKAEELGLADKGSSRDTKKLRKKGLI
ncbi:RabGAP/TBC [Basidiobolus meristosporus CBS 931.73]|uniref:RabGAP/TBC n=1 Tax=Basidiobolus meristosporus CBS 931.73 TaxID=1314790 RepID=A0A1Y1YJE9_9FUNG|nr:RabGAP/TBC [Basidiobolus meristosporus CBS 931.73]|eukprot:ORX97724.1 RabGAP/TBC [Basidiobolus meristosporus CBS 931.73]